MPVPSARVEYQIFTRQSFYKQKKKITTQKKNNTHHHSNNNIVALAEFVELYYDRKKNQSFVR